MRRALVRDCDVGMPLVTGAQQTGHQLQTDGWRPSTSVLKGTLFTIAGVTLLRHPAVPRVYVAHGWFVVTADCQADAEGQMTMPLWPPLEPGQTIDTVVADNAMVSLHGLADVFVEDYDSAYD